MKLINKQQLEDFKRKYPDAEGRIKSWETEVEAAEWKTPHDAKSRYPKASLIGAQQVVFNICGNKYRLLVKIAYKIGVVFIEKVGTHKEYDKWDIK